MNKKVIANKYARFYALISQINNAGVDITKEDVVSDFTNGRSSSLKDLKHWEFQELERQLIARANNNKKPSATNYENDHLNPIRRAIIAQFKSIGRTVEDAKNWAETYGVSGVKKMFNDYTGQELFKLLQNAKKIKSDYLKSANKKLTDNGKKS